MGRLDRRGASAAVSLLSGFDPLYSLSLLLPGLLPLFLTLWLRARKKLAAPSVIPLFIVAYATALTLVVAAALPQRWAPGWPRA